MKKILGLALALIAVIAIAASGTWAYFNDVQTASATLKAGTLMLDPTNADVDGNFATFTLGDDNNETNLYGIGIQPGDTGNNTQEWLIKNVGSLDGQLTISIPSAKFYDYENTPSSLEKRSGDSNDDGDPNGEFSKFCNIGIWRDTNGNSVVDSGDQYLAASGNVSFLVQDAQTHLQYTIRDEYAQTGTIKTETVGSSSAYPSGPTTVTVSVSSGPFYAWQNISTGTWADVPTYPLIFLKGYNGTSPAAWGTLYGTAHADGSHSSTWGILRLSYNFYNHTSNSWILNNELNIDNVAQSDYTQFGIKFELKQLP